jgi:hypothetical protein
MIVRVLKDTTIITINIIQYCTPHTCFIKFSFFVLVFQSFWLLKVSGHFGSGYFTFNETVVIIVVIKLCSNSLVHVSGNEGRSKKTHHNIIIFIHITRHKAHGGHKTRNTI